jgi:putative intracellular protease/amidase
MRKLLLGLGLVAGLFSIPPAQAASRDKVLIVVSSEGRDGGKTRPGFEFDEFAQAWSIFRSNGMNVEVASPAGGAAEPDQFEADKVYNAAVAADPEARKWLSATKATATIRPRDYAGIYVIGGGGAMFDVFADPALQTLLARAYEAGAVVGGVCHGPAVLSKVRLSSGRHLVAGRRVTGFTNAEEQGFGKAHASSYPIFLEDALKASGARFEQTRVMLPFVVTDGRIVTGQNPFSTAMSVDAMVKAMGKKPVARKPYPDERSLLLVAKFLGGEAEAAIAELHAAPEAHDIMLIGIYGAILAGGTEKRPEDVAQGLSLMEMAATRVSNPRLDVALAEAEHRLGRTAGARKRLEKLLSSNPDNKAAKRLLASMPE